MTTNPIPPQIPGFCGCGCGQPAARRYKPGHDARHKGILLQIARAGRSDHAEKAINQMLDMGWGTKVDLDLLRSLPIRNGRGQRRVPLLEIETFLIDQDGEHHAFHNCRRLTACAKRHGQINSLTKLANQAAIERIPSTPALLVSLTWGGCPECTVDWTWDEVIERILFDQATCPDANPRPQGKAAKAARVIKVGNTVIEFSEPSPWAAPTGNPIPLQV